MKAELSTGVERVKTFADCLMAITNPTRLEIVQYCLKPRSFSDIIFNLRMNPNTFSFHSKVLMEYDLITKVSKGVYETSELGKMLLELVEHAEKMKKPTRKGHS